jgi:hypothetical protein
VSQKCTPFDTTKSYSGQLPLHLYTLNCYIQELSEVSDRGDCFRLLIQLYLAAPGIKDNHSMSPYDIAVSKKLLVYFIRLLLRADSTIDPVRRHNLNYAARRQGMFLAFRALSSNIEPIIWVKLRFEDIDSLNRVLSYL